MTDTKKDATPDVAVDGGFRCGVCADNGVDAVFKNERALGAHKSAKHGITGQSRTSQFRRQKAAREQQGIGTGSDPIAAFTQSIDQRITGDPDIEGYINLIREMSQELKRLWRLENEFKQAIAVSSVFRETLEGVVEEDERLQRMARPRLESVPNLVELRGLISPDS